LAILIVLLILVFNSVKVKSKIIMVEVYKTTNRL